MATPNSAYRREQEQAEGPTTGRPVIYATQGVISSGHYLTSMAGMKMLLDGGNAFDAVVAASFAAAVVEPIASCSLAAEGVFMLYHAQTNEMLSLSGQGVAPGRATVDFYRSQGLESIPTGPGDQAHLSFTVPGIVDALISMLERFGSTTLSKALAPSIELADRGFPHYEYMIGRLDSQEDRDQFDRYPPGGSNVFYSGGELPRPGAMLVQKELGGVLQALANAEKGASGDRAAGLQAARDAFYRGEVASMLVAGAQRVGGILELDDLAGYRAKYEQPVTITFAGHEISTQRTWTQAPVLLEALNILETSDLAAMGHNSPAYVHTVSEALKLAFADREAYYGDPDFKAVPIDGLLSKEYAELRAELIDPEKAFPELPPPGDPWQRLKVAEEAASAVEEAARIIEGAASEDQGTTHIAALDRFGNLACATPSGGSFNKSVFIPEIGCALSTRIEMFNFKAGHPNELVPGKRPRTTLVNYIVSRRGRPVMTVGCPGGDHQAQGNLQLILNTLVFGMNPQEAIEAPRFATNSVPNSFYPHQYLKGQLALEPGFPSETADALRALGHEVTSSGSCGLGATVTHRDPDSGVLSAGADPRRACYAIGW